MKYFSEKDIHANPEVVELRGMIISKAISIEAIIDKIIIHYFIGSNKEKYSVMHDAIVKDLSASKKQDVLKRILKQLPLKDSEGVVNKLSSSLSSLFRTRNSMAHAEWAMIDSDSVTFIKNQGSANVLMNKKEVEKFEKDYQTAYGWLTKIYFEHFADLDRYRSILKEAKSI